MIISWFLSIFQQFTGYQLSSSLKNVSAEQNVYYNNNDKYFRRPTYNAIWSEAK